MRQQDSNNRNKKIILSLLLFVLCMLNACTYSEPLSEKKEDYKEYAIAVVLPFSSDLEKQWHNVIDWVLDNLNSSLKMYNAHITAEWYNEDTENIEALFRDLANRDEINAIIGPVYSANVEIAASFCASCGKTLVPASATSEQMMRAFSDYGFLWCLTENDISQCELLLATAIRKGAKSISLLTDTGPYGQTFFDWFAFQAEEMRLEVRSVLQYDYNTLDVLMEKALREDTDCLICIPRDEASTRRMNELRYKYSSDKPFLLFSDVAFLSTPDNSFEGMEGIAQIYSPYSTFHNVYEEKYGIQPGYAAAHFYDAVMLVGLALGDCHLTGRTDLNASLRCIVCGKGAATDWTGDGINKAINILAAGEYPHLAGASGELRFADGIFTNVLHSYYCHWQISEGKRVILEYTTSDPEQRTDSSVANWNWDISGSEQSFSATHFTYPVLRNLHVLIVAASSGWSNYRHQADAYALYRLVRENHVPDENIILVAEDDLAYHFQNPEPGCIRTSPKGKNIYENLNVDYHPSGLEPSDLYCILSGDKRAYLPHVIVSDSTDNLLVYWVGHGSSDGYLGWNDRTFPMDTLASYFRSVTQQKLYRKVFIAMETCYSGIFGRQCMGIKGVMCMAAAAEKETSKACNFNALLRVWMSNSFSENLFTCIDVDKEQKIYELYRRTYKNTIGSHVSVYNADYFDNLYYTSIGEFVSR